eukprot:Sspe_Gene.61296::Locus_34007_Transcript_2_3_Confidence_0.714_Length_541::g.61296::m.61296
MHGGELRFQSQHAEAPQAASFRQIGCYPPFEGYTSTSAVKSCYGDDKEAAYASLWNHLGSIRPSPTQFTKWPGLWQEGVNTVEYGTLYGSSLLLDESRSGLN